jgi:hypothetical protein
MTARQGIAPQAGSRSCDPETGQGWKGTGIAPDVPGPAADARNGALQLAGVDPATPRVPAGAR